ncbi:hypothetical protein [Streptomyces venezuelae]|uniref:Uncharacterized protein n=1 Tax=Streptomyces venezuelae TaxID=54571 RepID=A0A5P2BHK4_STRVZ|nr:hypothetical protein [Streptomyces venezuelae]QES29198.1 hypothetical protein DEJ47_24660 [Streptomyces venezuelae]
MKTTLFKLAAMSVIAFAATATVTIPAQAHASSPAPMAGASKTLGPAKDGPTEEEIARWEEREEMCKISGIVGWFGNQLGGNEYECDGR